MNLREQKKIDKARRIEQAARDVFGRKGYRLATMREIAEQAGVATGTLFLYAADKRDLLILLVNEDLDALTERSRAAVEPSAPLVEQLVELFRPRYAYWGLDRRLGLDVLQEVQITQSGDYAPESAMARYQRHRAAIVTHIAALIAAKQRAGEANDAEAADVLASLVMLIYASAVRFWLRAPATPVEEGIAELRRYLRIALAGVSRGPA